MKRTTSSELLVRLGRANGVSLRLQLERELRRAIQSGRLRPGAILPATRALAQDLDVSRGVVVEAYEQLLAEGYLVARHGSATRVAARETARSSAPAPDARTPTPRYDFRPGVPDLSLFPVRAWMMSIRRALEAAPHTAFDYPDPRGPRQARAALAEYLNRARATRASADRLVFCGGSAQGIGLLCQVLRARGVRSIAVEDPGHADQCTDIRAAGLQTPRVPVDEQGLCIDRLNRINAGAVLVTPAHQYPTGAVLSAERRARLLEWAVRRDAFIIEDDYDAEYRYDREPIGALQGLAPERVAYVGSVSKTLSPALRIGWVLAPANLAAEFARLKFRSDRGAPTLELLALADFLQRGELDRHLRRTRQIYRRRRNLVVEGFASRFPALRIRGIAAGLHLMVHLAATTDENAIVAEAAKQSMRLYGARQYYANRDDAPPALVVGYGSLDESAIPPAVDVLSEVLKTRRRA